ncbi:MAG: cysteine--tRNA ligase [Nitrososphaeraceae archaeon]
MKIYNTLTRRFDNLEDNNQKNLIRIYLCGVTVYDNSHVGHARTIIVFDVLRRYLLSKGCNVKFIQNFTDIDDKIINRAKRDGVKPQEITRKYTQRYFEDFNSLNVLAADLYPKATDHIEDMIRLIGDLIKKGYAYITLNGIYFRVKKFVEYGKLSKRSLEELESGSRIEVDSSKEDSLDFALWKFHLDEPNWTSPWGRGRPGWHIECSAMALKYFGSSFEIHGGGQDLIFPHHENEIAQSEAINNGDKNPFVKIWMHIGMVNINSEKMAKSLGNTIIVQEAIKNWGANTLRLYCLSAQYSKPLDFSDKLIEEARQRWRQIETCAYELLFADTKVILSSNSTIETEKLCVESEKEFKVAMESDLNTPLALVAFMKFVKTLNQLSAEDKLTAKISRIVTKTFDNFMYTLGLKLVEPAETEKKQIEIMISIRNELRSKKKFIEADEIRKKLSELYSVDIIDHKDRTIWKKTEKGIAATTFR